MNDRTLIRWVILVVVVISLLNLPASMTGGIKSAFRETARPLQRAMDSFFGAGLDYVRSLGRIPGLLGENQALRQEITRLRAEQNYWRLVENENAQLREVLKFEPPPETDWIAAKVLARSRDGWWQTIRLNKGSADGLRDDMAVVSMDGLIGRIVAVSRGTADVLLLSDPAFKVSALLLRTGAFGVVGGRGPSWRGEVFCRMEFIHKNETIQPGDEVVTSGLGGVFPANLVIGYVDKVYMDDSGLYQYADVITRADLSSLQYVYVVRQVERHTEGGRDK